MFQLLYPDLIKKLAKQIGVLSEHVKLYMYLPTANRYYALNDRTINLLMEGNVDMGATAGEQADGEHADGDDEGGNTKNGDKISVSDAEVKVIVNSKKEVEVFTTEKIRQEQVAHSFHILILPYLIYLNIAFLKLLVEITTNITVYT